MKTIGMIGGMSSESSALYYQLINEETTRLLGGQYNAPSLMATVDFADVERLRASWYFSFPPRQESRDCPLFDASPATSPGRATQKSGDIAGRSVERASALTGRLLADLLGELY